MLSRLASPPSFFSSFLLFLSFFIFLLFFVVFCRVESCRVVLSCRIIRVQVAFVIVPSCSPHVLGNHILFSAVLCSTNQKDDLVGRWLS